MCRKSSLLVFVVLLILSGTRMVGQDVVKEGLYDKSGKLKKAYLKAEYTRPGMTILLVDNAGHKYNRYLANTLETVSVPSNYDDNNLTFKERHVGAESLSGRLSEGAKAVIGKLYARQQNGLFSQEEINKRAKFNATDAEAEIAMQTQQQISTITTKGEVLLDNCYLLVFTPGDILTMEEHYNNIDAQARENAKKFNKEFVAVKRDYYGYTGTFNYTMYKLDMSGANLNYFRDSLYIDQSMVEGDKIDPTPYVQRWAKYTPVVQAVYSGSAGGSGVYSRETKPQDRPSDQSLFNDLMQGAVAGAQENLIEAYSPFHVKSKIVDESPIGAKIGKKESLKLDARFFVYEQRLSDKNEMYSHRMGVVRSYWIANNNFDVTDAANNKLCDTSLFYQTAGSRLRVGMFMEHNPDAGLAVALGYSAGNLGGLTFRLEYSVAGLVRSKGSALEFLKGYKTGLDVNLTMKNDLKVPFYKDGDYMFARMMFDQSIEWVVMRNFSLAPIVGIGAEFAFKSKEKNGPDEYSFGALMANVGFRAGMNITYNIQLQGTVKYHLIFGKTIVMPPKDSGADSEWADIKWDEVFEGRKGIIMNVGLRYSF